MTDAKGARDSYLGGDARFKDWQKKFDDNWLKVDPGEFVMRALAMTLADMTEEEHEIVREMDPEAYDAVMKQIEGGV